MKIQILGWNITVNTHYKLMGGIITHVAIDTDNSIFTAAIAIDYDNTANEPLFIKAELKTKGDKEHAEKSVK